MASSVSTFKPVVVEIIYHYILLAHGQERGSTQRYCVHTHKQNEFMHDGASHKHPVDGRNPAADDIVVCPF